MIDIHCHLLPGIDDGPKTIEESVAMARLALKNGITHAIVTPHIHPERYNNTIPLIEQTLASFKEALLHASVPLEVGYAAEVRLSDEILTMVQEQSLPFYGEQNGYKVLLLEFPHGNIPIGCDNLVQWLLDHKIRPMIAHPERNKDVMRNFDKILPFIEMGCLFQLTAGSLVGLFGKPAQLTAQALLENGCVTLLASDAHNITRRPPAMKSGCDAAAKIVGKELARQMVLDRPWELVAAQFDDWEDD